MNELSFRYFLAVAEANSIKRAANVLMISPQSLSEHMRKLEQELGVELFTHTRPVRLTACGQRFARYARSMVQQRYQMERELREMSDRHREIVISVPPTDFPPFLSEVLADFTEQYPDCLVSVLERGASSITPQTCDLNLSEESLGKDMTEILIQNPDEEHPAGDLIAANQFSVVVRRSLLERSWGEAFPFRYDAAKNRASLLAFRDIPMIRFYNESLDGSIEKLFIGEGFLPLVAAKAVSSGICADLCAAGVGYMVVPDGWALRRLGARIESGEIELFRLPYYYPSPRMILSYPAGKTITKEELALVEMIRDFVNNL